MGKSKKRAFNKNLAKDFEILKREDVIKRVVRDIRNKEVNENTIKYISFFGITCEELTEEGIMYEEIKAMKQYILEFAV